MSLTKLAERGVTVLLFIMTIADAAVLLYWRAVIVPHKYSIETLTRGPRVAPVDGYSAAGIAFRGPSGQDAGWIVRYASSKCEYCRLDEPEWAKVSDTFRQRGFRVIYLSPYANLAEQGRNVAETPQLAYISMEWIKQFRLVSTPSTVIVGRDHRLLWSHAGTMSTYARSEAFRSLRNYGGSVGSP